MEVIVPPFQSWLSLWHRVDLVLPRVKIMYLLIEAQISSDKSSLRLNYWHEYKCVMSFCLKGLICVCVEAFESTDIFGLLIFKIRTVITIALPWTLLHLLWKKQVHSYRLERLSLEMLLRYRFTCIRVRVIWVCCKKTKKIYSNLEDNRCFETPSSTHRVGELRS